MSTDSILYSYGTSKAAARAKALAVETLGQKITRHARRIVLAGDITETDCMIASGMVGLILGITAVVSMYIHGA